MRKTLLTIILLLTFALSLAYAQEGEVIVDLRCQREKLFREGQDLSGTYAEYCKVDGNTERELFCLNQRYPEGGSDSLFGRGGFNWFQTDVVFNRVTTPVIIRTIIIIIIALLGIATIWVVSQLYSKGVSADTEDTMKEVWKGYGQIGWGIFWTAAGFGGVALILYLSGYRPAEIINMDDEFDALFNVNCVGLDRDSCRQYNISCNVQTVDCEDRGMGECEAEIRKYGKEVECVPKEEKSYPSESQCNSVI